MKQLRLILGTTTLALVLAACGKTSTATSSNAASSVLTVTPTSTTVALSGTTNVTVTGGTGTYVSASATQGTMILMFGSTFQYTAPATAATTVVTLTVTDSAGAIGTAVVILGGTTTTTTGTTTTASVGGQYTFTVGSLSGTLTLTQDSTGAIAGNFFISQYSYYYPVTGAVSGSQVSFKDILNNNTYVGTLTSSGGQNLISGTLTTTAGSAQFSATSTALTAAPVTGTISCGGTYAANIAGNAGTLRLVYDGSGTVSGYLLLQNQYYYAMTGTCGAGSITLRNLTVGSNYTGTAQFSGTSATLSGSFTMSDGTTNTWSATK